MKRIGDIQILLKQKAKEAEMAKATDVNDKFEKEMEQENSKWEEVIEIMADVHNFQEEAELSGILTEKKENVGENQSWMYLIKKSDGNIVSVWGSTVLDSRFAKIEVGEEVRVIYQGKQQMQGGRSFHKYQVFHRPAPFKEAK